VSHWSRAACLDAETAAQAEVVLRDASLRRGSEVIGTIAARDDIDDPLNYEECFVRDFAVSAAAFLAVDEFEVVRSFLREVAALRPSEVGSATPPADGLMPASFAVARSLDAAGADGDRLVADYGQRAIGRVAPVDSALWWILILRAYVRASGDEAFVREGVVQAALGRVLTFYLREQFEMLPSLLVPDGSSMIDRRMGVYGHPFDVQALFFAGLRAACELLGEDDPLRGRVFERLAALGRHLRDDYWLDRARIEAIRRYPVEEFGDDQRNPWNLHPDAIPVWTMAWLAEGGGYFAGNLGPARLDVRFFALGNLLAVSSGLATPAQATALFELIRVHERDLVGDTGMKLTYPPLEGRDWYTLTGSDQKNVPWSYHNGGTWPMLLWPLASAARRAGCQAFVESIVERSAPRLARDEWPEYYDGPFGGLIGRRARLRQTWTAAATLAAAALLGDPDDPDPFAFEHDDELERAIAAATPDRVGRVG
jgi:glycogen debranching enzyme